MGVKSAYNFNNSGKMLFWDGSSPYETVLGMYGVNFYDDFNSAFIVIPEQSAPESGCVWTKKTVTAGVGTPTCVVATDGGYAILTLASTDEEEEITLYMNDQHNFDVTKKLIFEARVKLATLGSTATELMFFGLAGDLAKGFATVAQAIGFETGSSGLVYVSCDDGTTDTRTTSGTTVLATAWHTYRIEVFDTAKLSFYIDGTEVCASSTIPFTATGASAILQPYFTVYKSAGASEAVMQVDYIKIMHGR